MSGVKAESSKPWWWKPLWIAVILSSIALGIVGYFLWHVALEILVGGVALTFLCIGIAYYIRIRPSMKVNRALYIVLGASGTELLILFGGAFIIWATGLPPPTDYLGPWPTLILLFIVPLIVGGYIGYLVGKRRNYRPYI